MSNYLLPISALIRRELLSLLRTRRAFVILCLLALGVGGVVYLNFEIFGDPVYRYMFNPAVAAQSAFAWLLGLCLPLAIVVVGPLAAASVLEERQKETFELLRLAPFTAGQIAIAKILNGIGFYILLIIAVLPVVGVLFFFTGVEVTRFVQALLISLMAALSVACVGTAASARFNKRNAAIMITFVGAAFVLGIPQIIAGGLGIYMINEYLWPLIPDHSQDFFRGGVEWTQVLAYFATPLLALGETLDSNVRWSRIAITLAGQSVLVVIAFLIARGGINLSLYSVSRGRRIAALLETSVMATPVQLLQAGVGGYALKDKSNPIAWQCLHSAKPVNPRFAWTVQIIAVLILIAVGTIAFRPANGPVNQVIAMWCGSLTVALLLMIPALVSGYVTRDYETNGMDLLRATLLPPATIVNGRLKASFISLLPFFLITLLGAAPLFYLRWLDNQNLVGFLFVGYLSMFLCAFFAVIAALHGAIYTKDSRRALVYAYLSTIGMFVGPFLFFMTIAILGGDFEESMIPMASPMVTFIALAANDDVAVGYWIGCVIAFSMASLIMMAISYVTYESRHIRDV